MSLHLVFRNTPGAILLEVLSSRPRIHREAIFISIWHQQSIT